MKEKVKLPPPLIRDLIRDYHIEEEAFLDSHADPNVLSSVRLNPLKPSNRFEQAAPVPWCNTGRYLPERPLFTADPLFHAGCYYVQEASSMFVEQVFKQWTNLDTELRVLDLCAAPGGKSSLISSLISEDSLLLSNEIIKSRVPVLATNLSKWGRHHSFVSNNDPRDFRRVASFFDVMLVDAPCSGSGLFRKDPDAIGEWSESLVQLCSERQQRILADSFPALKEDGVLIYSTCSYSRQENEDICDWLCDNFDVESLPMQLEASWGIEQSRSEKHKSFGYRFYPHKVRGEGFFIAAFRKKSGEKAQKLKKTRDSNSKAHVDALAHRWLNPSIDLKVISQNETLFAVNPRHEADLQHLQSALYLKKTGVCIGRIVGRDLIPDHELALSLILNPDIPRIELNREQAIGYLKRDELRLETSLRSWALVSFESHALGWAKILDQRINNYFPKELRIVNQAIR